MSKKNFVNNAKLYDAFVEYRKTQEVQEFLERKRLNLEARARGEKPPRFTETAPPLPTYIASCISIISLNYARKPNWKNIPFLAEMICDATAFVLRYGYNFNPEKTQNPFAYITQGIHRSFLQKIADEKKQDKIKREIYQRASLGMLPSYSGVSSLTSTHHSMLMSKHEDDIGLLEQQYPKVKRQAKMGRKRSAQQPPAQQHPETDTF